MKRNMPSAELRRSKMKLETLYQHCGYKLTPACNGYRVHKPEANLYNAFWSETTALNFAASLVRHGRRIFERYRDIPKR